MNTRRNRGKHVALEVLNACGTDGVTWASPDKAEQSIRLTGMIMDGVVTICQSRLQGDEGERQSLQHWINESNGAGRWCLRKERLRQIMYVIVSIVCVS